MGPQPAATAATHTTLDPILQLAMQRAYAANVSTR
jgi:hypothetical protein